MSSHSNNILTLIQ